MLEPAPRDLRDGGHVIGVAVPGSLLDSVAPVVRLAWQAVFKDNEGSHHIGALDVRNIRTFDAQWCRIHAQGFLQLLQSSRARRQVTHALEFVLTQLLFRIALHSLHERAFIAALRHAQVYLCAAKLLQNYLDLIGFLGWHLDQNFARDGIASMNVGVRLLVHSPAL